MHSDIRVVHCRSLLKSLQDCLRTGRHLSLSPGMSILTHLPEVTPCSPVGAEPATAETRCNDSNGNTDSIAAFLPSPRGQIAPTLVDHGTSGDGVAAEDALHALQRDPLDTDLRIATPPAAQNGGSLLMQRVSDAATSPVDSFWVRLFLGLSLQVHACIALTVGSHWLQSV